MTATEVDGVAVVSDEPQVAPFKDKQGAPIHLPQTRVLTLANGAVVYGCAHCDYTSTNPFSVRPHLNKHAARRNGHHKAAAGSPLNLSLADLMARLDKVDSLVTDRDQWKTRALSAERRLKQLRAALGMTT